MSLHVFALGPFNVTINKDAGHVLVADRVTGTMLEQYTGQELIYELLRHAADVVAELRTVADLRVRLIDQTNMMIACNKCMTAAIGDLAVLAVSPQVEAT